jgi:hypothetical protein
MKTKLLKYGIASVVGIFITVLVLESQGFFLVFAESLLQKEIQLICLMLCDGFFVSCILITLFGILVWIASTGFFDSLGYALKTAAHLLIPFKRGQRKSYYDYKMEKEEKRMPAQSFLIWVGLVFLAISAVFLCFWIIL